MTGRSSGLLFFVGHQAKQKYEKKICILYRKVLSFWSNSTVEVRPNGTFGRSLEIRPYCLFCILWEEIQCGRAWKLREVVFVCIYFCADKLLYIPTQGLVLSWTHDWKSPAEKFDRLSTFLKSCTLPSRFSCDQLTLGPKHLWNRISIFRLTVFALNSNVANTRFLIRW